MTTVDLDRIRDVRHQLLHLHKELLDLERVERERTHGRIAPADFLRLLIEDSSLAWLRPMTELIVRIDEWLDEDERDPDVATTWLREVSHLLTPDPAQHDFHHRYAQLLQASPELVIAQGAVMRALTGRRS
ncbi:MAG TPA: hypothetical protein VL463_23225 [Kofleriaceae bacterium]|jgi:hypothetical protein|nr:hypothetical protein [Kofleriaceae bacterium]